MHPLHHDEVLRFLSEGKLSTADALRLLRQTEPHNHSQGQERHRSKSRCIASFGGLNLLVGLKEVKGWSGKSWPSWNPKPSPPGRFEHLTDRSAYDFPRKSRNWKNDRGPNLGEDTP